MQKIGRYLFIVLGSVSLSFLMPELWHLVFDKNYERPIISYSLHENDFLIRDRINQKSYYYTKSGKAFSFDQYMQKLPLIYFRTLYANGKMPDSIRGINMDPHDINMSNFLLRLYSEDNDRPDYGTYPRFVSRGFKAPELTSNYFEFIQETVAVYNTEANKRDEEKSRKLENELKQNYFVFPPKLVAGNTRLRKKRDDGYLLVDAKKHLFHLTFNGEEPDVDIVQIPSTLRIKYIYPVEINSREFSFIIVSEKNEVFVLMNQGMYFEQLPITDYNPELDFLRIEGTMFQKTVVVYGSSKIRCTAINTEYELIDYMELPQGREKSVYDKLAEFLFPFHLEIKASRRSNTRAKITNVSLKSLYLNVILMLLFLFVTAKKPYTFMRVFRIESHIDIILILVFGLFAFPVCWMFPNDV